MDGMRFTGKKIAAISSKTTKLSNFLRYRLPRPWSTPVVLIVYRRGDLKIRVNLIGKKRKIELTSVPPPLYITAAICRRDQAFVLTTLSPT